MDIEKALLGLFIFYPSFSNRLTQLEADDFSETLLQQLFRLCLKCYKEKGTTDQATIGYQAKQINDELYTLLLDCVSLGYNQSLLDDYISFVKTNARNRRLKDKCLDVISFSKDAFSDLKNILDSEAENTVLSSDEKYKKPYSDFIANIGKSKDLLETGYHRLDFKLGGGIERGTYFIIGARPSTGKTTFALNIASNLIKQQRRVLFFSLEMSTIMIFERLFANSLSLDYSQIQSNGLPAAEVDKLKNAAAALRDTNNFMVDDDTYLVENICARITELKPDIVFVDFIQMIQTKIIFKNLREQINYISAELKRTAKQAGCVIVALSQVSRKSNYQDLPTMADLRESGALEQDGDYIVMLHRPYVADKRENPNKTKVLLDKNKFGGTGLTDFYFDGIHQRFTPLQGGEVD